MPAMFVFLLKVNIALLLFCAGYYLVLRHLTFYTLNRIYLVAAIVFATIYPKINLNDFALRHEQLARPVQAVVYNLETPVQTLVKPLVQPDYWYWLELVFWMGVGLLAGRLLVQLFSMYKLYRNSTPATIEEHEVRVINSDSGPFSFWKSIYINPSKHNATDLKAILLHEQVHVNELHTLDILLAELSTIFYWFNPGVWLMKKAVRENIEFITDRKILNKGIDSKEYQYSLVNVILTPSTQGIVNNFNLSTIKKRIIMMNAKRSSALNISRYLLLVPVVVALLLVFSVSKAELSTVGKSGMNILKTLKNNIISINFTNESPDPHKSKHTLKAKSTMVIPSDTLRLAGLLTYIDTTKKEQPELPLYIDGVRSSRTALGNIDPEKIARMVVYRDDKAKTTDPDKSGYISVITKENENSEAVKVFTDKMDKQYGRLLYGKLTPMMRMLPGQPTDIKNLRINGLSASPATVVNVNGTATPLVSSISGVQATPKLSAVTVVGSKLSRVNSDTVVVPFRFVPKDSLYGVKKVKIGGRVTIVNSKNRDSLFHAMSDVVMSTDGSLAKKESSPKVVNLTPVPSAHYIFSSIPGPINFTDKLIIIDGKEATQKQLKKISADKIQSVNNLSQTEAEKKYGDKGKNGAILITTKSK